MTHKKLLLDEKICKNCQCPFTWRKKWKKVWEEVLYCSKKCKNSR